VTFKHEGKDIEIGEKYTFNYSRNGIVKLQVSMSSNNFFQFVFEALTIKSWTIILKVLHSGRLRPYPQTSDKVVKASQAKSL
jgi:hypothetical protein